MYPCRLRPYDSAGDTPAATARVLEESFKTGGDLAKLTLALAIALRLLAPL
jgi:hypothetical protein